MLRDLTKTGLQLSEQTAKKHFESLDNTSSLA